MKTPPIQAIRQLHKFGGSSLADPQGYQRVASIVAQYSDAHDLVVVSAAGNTTDQLINWVIITPSAPLKADQIHQKLRYFHCQLINRLLPADIAQPLINDFEHDLTRLATLLPAAAMMIGGAEYAEIVGYGEVWSARLLAALLNAQGLATTWLDARDFLRAERAVQPKIDEGLSHPLLTHCLEQYPRQRLVITGFISRNCAGETVLLGRNGSDYSATQIGALANVQHVTLWSNVAGLYSADPHLVRDACLLPQLRLDEACALARLANPALHARTLQPLSSSHLTLQLRSSYQPDQGSTRVERALASDNGAKIVTCHDKACLLELALLPTHSYDAATLQQHLTQLVQQLQRAGLCPLTWSAHDKPQRLQWCFPFETVKGAFKLLQDTPLPGILSIRQGVSMLALVGSGVVHHVRHCEQFYAQIKDQPLEHLWQAEDGHSLAAVLRAKSGKPLLQPLHHALWGRRQRIGLVLFGKGEIGSRWLSLFAQQQKRSTLSSRCEWVLSGVVHEDRCWLDHRGLDVDRALAFFDSEATKRCDITLRRWLRQHPFDHLVALDTTARTALLGQYRDFAEQGLHVITTNRLVGSLSSEIYLKTVHAFKRAARHWLYSGAVGTGLPINQIVRDLRDSGDTLVAISGNFCGTLSWIFQHYDDKVSLTEQLRQAWQQGLTAADPRLDLSGAEAAHRLVMLARAAGYSLEAAQIRVESLVPPLLATTPLETFFETSNPLNQQLKQRVAAASAAGLTLRYIARFNVREGGRIGIEALALQHPLAALNPTEQVFMIESHWHQDPPLVIRGPGNRSDALAGSLQSDLNRLGQLL